ncbi:MAG: hypothetical protein LAT76_12995 [Schleiferiaceae bacterium]|nr:hypothetical protein [Schleiferiaceae bacterium]
MELINNQDTKLFAELKEHIQSSSEVYIATGYASAQAVFNLLDVLKDVSPPANPVLANAQKTPPKAAKPSALPRASPIANPEQYLPKEVTPFCKQSAPH